MRSHHLLGLAAVIGGILLLRLVCNSALLQQQEMAARAAAPSCRCAAPREASAKQQPSSSAGGSPAGGAADVDEPLAAAIGRRTAETDDTCQDGYFLSHLLSRFIDIDFIEFVLSSQPQPSKVRIVDIGIYQAGELVHMAHQGFEIIAFEASPSRYNNCMAEITRQPQKIQDRIHLHNLAVSDNSNPMHFQMAGLDGHLYEVDEAKGEQAKEKSIIVQTIPISKIVQNDTYFVKIDTQGFDTRILESLLGALESSTVVVPFIQFEFSPYFEVTRAKRSKEDHKKIFRRLMDLGYDVYQGAAVQPWIRSHRSQYGKSPLAMLAVDQDMPTCVDEFVEKMHQGKDRPIFPGRSSNDYGTWMDILAVRRMRRSPYYRHTGWVLSHRM
jgi:FkbM family methyltransferase